MVRDFDVADLPNECFGGEELYSGQGIMNMKTQKWRNAYLVFYERKNQDEMEADDEDNQGQAPVKDAKAEAQEKAAVQQTEEAAAREEERLRALEEERIQEEKRAQEEAERRRLEAAEKFKEEQEQARKRAQELAAEKVSKAKEAKAKMRTSIYGRFKRDK